jgi:hypothetical protein
MKPDDRHRPLLDSELLGQAACIAWVRDLAPEEVLRRFGGTSPFPARTLAELDAAVTPFMDAKDADGRWLEPNAAIAARLGGPWTLMIELNGFAATMAGELAAISAGVEVVSIFWNVNGLSEITIARDGDAAAVVHDVVVDFTAGGGGSLDMVEGSDPTLAADLIAVLATVGDNDDWRAAALRWAEQYTNAPIPAGWLDRSHASAAFGRPQRSM